MASKKRGKLSERQIVQAYVAEHSIESTINEVLNKCCKERPDDPFKYMADLLGEKSTAAKGIVSLVCREVLDSSGKPTLEVELTTDVGTFRASAPSLDSGSFNSEYETKELRDGTASADHGVDAARYGGNGVAAAVKVVNEVIAPVLIGKDPANQEAVDSLLSDLDGTGTFEKLGVNGVIAVSVAVCRAGASQKGVPLYRHVADLAQNEQVSLPVPFFTAMSGGELSGKANLLPFREFMILPVAAETFREALQTGCDVVASLKEILQARETEREANDEGDDRGLVYDVEGGIAVNADDANTAVGLLAKAIAKAGYEGKVKVAINVASAQFCTRKGTEGGERKGEDGDGDAGAVAEEGSDASKEAAADAGGDGAEGGGAGSRPSTFFYNMQYKEAEPGAGAEAADDGVAPVGISSAELKQQYAELVDAFPDLIVSIEDPFDVDDWIAFAQLTEESGATLQVSGGNLTVSNIGKINAAVEAKAVNAVTIKTSQAGTISECLRACKLAQAEGLGITISHASGDNVDTFYADLAVGLNAGQLKAGGVMHAERLEKYNQLLRIEEELEGVSSKTGSLYVGSNWRFPGN